jgi:hypothetical protein
LPQILNFEEFLNFEENISDEWRRYLNVTSANPEEAIGFRLVLRAIEKHGNPSVPLPQGPPFFLFSNTDEYVRALTASGFASPEVLRVPMPWKMKSADDCVLSVTGLDLSHELPAVPFRHHSRSPKGHSQTALFRLRAITDGPKSPNKIIFSFSLFR